MSDDERREELLKPLVEGAGGNEHVRTFYADSTIGHMEMIIEARKKNAGKSRLRVIWETDGPFLPK